MLSKYSAKPPFLLMAAPKPHLCRNSGAAAKPWHPDSVQGNQPQSQEAQLFHNHHLADPSAALNKQRISPSQELRGLSKMTQQGPEQASGKLLLSRMPSERGLGRPSTSDCGGEAVIAGSVHGLHPTGSKGPAGGKNQVPQNLCPSPSPGIPDGGP